VAVLGHAPCEHVAQRDHSMVVEHRRPGPGIDQVQPQAEPPAKRIERRRPEIPRRQGQPQQVIEMGNVAELLGPVLVGLGDSPHDVAEPDRVRHGEQRQLEVPGALGQLRRERSATGAKADHQPARADSRQPLSEVHLAAGLCPYSGSVREQQLSWTEVVPRLRQVRRMRPGDLAVQTRASADQGELQAGLV